MTEYRPKGKKTKQKIIDTTKRLFYENGYNNVYVKDITHQCGIAAGNFTYYFPTKDSVAVEIFSQYINHIFEFIDTNICDIDHFYYKNLIMSLIFNINVFRDANIVRYYREVMHQRSHHYLLRMGIDEVYRFLLISFDIHYDEDEYFYFTCADLGARHEILINFMDGNFHNMDVIKLVRVLHNNTSKLMGIPQDLFDTMFDKAISILNQYDFSKISML